MLKKRLLELLIVGLAVTTIPCAFAESSDTYPNQAIRMVVPFPAGQVTDILARTISTEIAATTGQSVVVENKPGANAAIGAGTVARAKPDGYTLLFGSNSPMAGNMAFFKAPGYDAEKDFEPIALVARTGWAVAVKDDAPYKDFADLVNAATADPGSVSIGGGTTGYQMAATLLTKFTKADMVVVPYNGTPQLTTDVLGGHVDAITADIGTISRLIEAGSMRALVALTPNRISLLPDVPTLKELGYGQLDLEFSWMGVFAPKGTPLPIQEKLASLVQQAIDTESVQQYLREQRMDGVFLGPKEFAKLQSNDIESYKNAMVLAGMQPN